MPITNLQKYTVYRREIISGKEVDVRESSVLSGPNYLELSALQSNRRYDIWVKAETSAGYGASSDITSIILGHTGITTYKEILAEILQQNLKFKNKNQAKYRGPVIYFIEGRSPSRHKWRFCN